MMQIELREEICLTRDGEKKMYWVRVNNSYASPSEAFAGDDGLERASKYLASVLDYYTKHSTVDPIITVLSTTGSI